MLDLIPLPQSQGNIADKGSHPSLELPPGGTHQQTVGHGSRDLGVGCGFGIAVDQVIAQQAVGAIGFADLLPGFMVHSVTHGIAHRKAQKASPVSGFFLVHN